MPGKTVLADPQFGIARILRPFSGFETVYQGQIVSRQLMLSEVTTPPGGDAIDPLAAAGTTGYAANLVKGLAVPFGARVILWLPKITPNSVSGIRYKWSMGWRLRNVFDYRQARIPFHYPKQDAGVADTTAVTGGARVVIPAANQTIPYTESPEPAGFTAPTASSLRIEDVTTGGLYPGVSIGLPLTPAGGIAALQQGILNPDSVFGGSGTAQSPFYQIHEIQAVGDELCIGLWRDNPGGGDPSPTWDFAGFDAPVQNFLGNGTQGVVPDVGVYVIVGSAP